MITLEEKKERISGLAATIIFHVLLLLLFLLIKFPVQEMQAGTENASEGILIDFGNSEMGMGEEKAMQADQTASESSSQKNEVSESDENIATQNTEPAPSIASHTKTQKEISEPQPDENLLNVLNKVHSNTSSNSGDGTTTSGNQGAPSGTPNSNYSGFAGPGGISGKIKGSGRKMIGDVAIYDDSQEIGIVAVEILVDKYGKVTKAEPVLMGSTTTSLHLWKKAKEGLLNQILFNQSPAGEEARGTVYINFSVR